MSKIELMKHVQSHYESHPILIEGYAPFCKHIFMPNLDPHIRDAAVQITPQNERLLCTAYQARKDDELPVLVRFFPRGSVEPPVSKFLDLIRTLSHFKKKGGGALLTV